jgi:hypothetical protein
VEGRLGTFLRRMTGEDKAEENKNNLDGLIK